MHSMMEDIHWMFRDTSPFAIGFAGLALLAMALFAITKWKEFMMIGLTSGIYVIPFLMSGKLHY